MSCGGAAVLLDGRLSSCVHDEGLYCAKVGGRKNVNDVLMVVGPIDKQRISTRI